MPADIAVNVGKHQVLPDQAEMAARLKTFLHGTSPVQFEKPDGTLVEDLIIR